MSVQLLDAPTDVLAAAGDVEAELSVLENAVTEDASFTIRTAFSSLPLCCTLGNF